MLPFALLIVSVLLAGCDSNIETEPVFLSGSYDQVFLCIKVDGEVAREGLAGVYVDEVVSFERDRTVAIDYFSDLQDEEGRAEGTYLVEGDVIVLYISTSSTSVYPAGAEFRYDSFAQLEEDYRTTYDVDGPREFSGPGLVLRKRRSDEGDLDRDGDRTEALVEEYFYFFKSTR